ncbi:MmyB family transcriptional regulator [Nocardia sp. NPDC004278]
MDRPGLRLVAGQRPGDPDLIRLLHRMTAGSPEFRDMWATHNVNDTAHGRYHLDHDLVGTLHLDFEFIPLPADPGVWAICLYSAEPGTPSAIALQDLIMRDLEAS